MLALGMAALVPLQAQTGQQLPAAPVNRPQQLSGPSYQPEPMEPLYESWLTEQVPYLITDAERIAFLKLTTNAERGAFIAQFWKNHDTKPGMTPDQFRDAYLKRVAFANANFQEGVVAGWQTDRGRIYITYGEPDTVEAAPIHFRITWGYKHLDGIGDNVQVRFEDPSHTGSYIVTFGPAPGPAVPAAAAANRPY